MTSLLKQHLEERGDDFFCCLKPEHVEMEWAWEELSKEKLNEGLDNGCVALNEDETWQHLGIESHNGIAWHCFRHRHHPKTKRREYLLISTSKEFEKDYEDLFGNK